VKPALVASRGAALDVALLRRLIDYGERPLHQGVQIRLLFCRQTAAHVAYLVPQARLRKPIEGGSAVSLPDTLQRGDMIRHLLFLKTSACN